MKVRKTTVEVREYESSVFASDPRIVEAIETDFLKDEACDDKDGAVACVKNATLCDFQALLTAAGDNDTLLTFLELVQIDSIPAGRLRRLVAVFQFALRQLKRAAGRV